MLFRKKIDPHCSYCKYASAAEPGTVICKKKGIRSDAEACKCFRYDPLKRVPPKPARIDFTKYDEQDYSL